MDLGVGIFENYEQRFYLVSIQNIFFFTQFDII
jgi:hypothetical protein